MSHSPPPTPAIRSEAGRVVLFVGEVRIKSGWTRTKLVKHVPSVPIGPADSKKYNFLHVERLTIAECSNEYHFRLIQIGSTNHSISLVVCCCDLEQAFCSPPPPTFWAELEICQWNTA